MKETQKQNKITTIACDAKTHQIIKVAAYLNVVSQREMIEHIVKEYAEKHDMEKRIKYVESLPGLRI